MQVFIGCYQLITKYDSACRWVSKRCPSPCFPLLPLQRAKSPWRGSVALIDLHWILALLVGAVVWAPGPCTGGIGTPASLELSGGSRTGVAKAGAASSVCMHRCERRALPCCWHGSQRRLWCRLLCWLQCWLRRCQLHCWPRGRHSPGRVQHAGCSQLLLMHLPPPLRFPCNGLLGCEGRCRPQTIRCGLTLHS